ncbi:phosphoporin PhoE (plasmid) [Pantoea cypripedii]|uniref:Phosphoporin PhoE n=2 Tax=Pantoea cypripedii TaxID=55209 RepID=A0A6B9GBT7_PANCY|nr:phosphoporin PhoE [Pantoea cypripedii]
MEMNKKILAVALCFISSNAFSAVVYDKDNNRLDLFGVVIGEFSNVTSGARASRGDTSFSEIGFNGQTTINDTLKGFGFVEYRFYTSAAEGSQTEEVRQAYAGLQIGKHDYLSYGRTFGVMYNVESYADMAPSVTGKTWAADDNYMMNRTNSVLTWKNTDLLGLDENLHLTVQFQGKNDTTFVKSNGDGIGSTLSYSLGKFSVIGGYSLSDRTTLQKADGKGSHAESWAVGMKWEPGNFYFGTVYAETRNLTLQANDTFANKTRNYEVIGQYQTEFGLRPSLSWVYTEGGDLESSGSFKGGKAAMANYIEMGASYALNTHAGVYADFLLNMMKNNDYTNNVGGLFAGTGNKLVLGIYYGF